MSPRRNTAPSPSRRRNTAASALALTGAVALAACSADRVTAPAAPTPDAAPALAVTGQTVTATQTALDKVAKDAAKRMTDAQLTALAPTWRTAAADREAPTDMPAGLSCNLQSVSMVQTSIGRNGGTLRFGRGELRVPAGALANDVRITATVTLGRGVRVEFAPHGLQFAKAVEVRVNWTGCALPTGGSANLYYTNDQGLITQVMPSATTGPVSRMLTDHFSGYAVGWSRTRAY